EQLIEGVQFRAARPVAHEAGHVTEVMRSEWDIGGMPLGPAVQTYITTTLAGRVRGWGFHRHTTDRLFVASGLLRIVIFDGRSGSTSCGRINQFTLSEKNPGLIVIPPNLYHGWKNIGSSEAILISAPDTPYDYES